MSILDQFQFHVWDGTGMIAKLVEEWKPGDCSTEKQYEKSLYEFLHERLEDIQITKQFARGRVRADIVVGDKVIIELKNNLDTTGKFQRLVGQIADYKNWEGETIIVLCGATDSNLRKELDRYLEDEGLSGGVGPPTLFPETVLVIQK